MSKLQLRKRMEPAEGDVSQEFMTRVMSKCNIYRKEVKSDKEKRQLIHEEFVAEFGADKEVENWKKAATSE